MLSPPVPVLLSTSGGMSIAGKTGTTSDYNDIWFSGYTPYYTCTTWTGYDNNTKLLARAKNEALAKKLWKAVMSQVHEGLETNLLLSLPISSAQTVCAKSGKLPTALCGETLKTEYFAVDTVPTETCDVHYQGSVCAYSGLPAADACPFATEGTLEMLPENERILTGQVTSEDSQRSASTAPSSWQPRCRSDHRAGTARASAAQPTLHSTKLCS